MEMLKVWAPSPPVAQVSTTGSLVITGMAFALIVLASPTISSTVSPLRLSAVTKAPNWAGVASPRMISSIIEAASSLVSERPDTKVCIASLIILATPLQLSHEFYVGQG